jgi:NADH:ubiquinone oxidoreductase subunit 6 (subunit J)
MTILDIRTQNSCHCLLRCIIVLLFIACLLACAGILTVTILQILKYESEPHKPSRHAVGFN